MAQEVLINDDYYVPDANQLITEDDTPVDNFASAKEQTPVDNFASFKQQRLLVSSLQSQTFLAEANVGIYYTDLQPPIVPDVFLSLDVQVPKNCYLVWHFGKPPEVVLEIVSNKEGTDDDTLQTYCPFSSASTLISRTCTNYKLIYPIPNLL